MACETWRKQLELYLDGELGSSEAAALSAHVRGCPACAGAMLERVQLKRSVQMAGKRYAPSAELRSRISKQVLARPGAGNVRRWRLVLVPVLAVLIAAVLLSAYFERERAAKRRLYSELVDLHVATLASSSPVDVVSTDRHTVKPWFQGKIPFTFNLPELAGSNFTLLGGRVFYLEQTAGAHLIYQVRKHEISVFILPERRDEMQRLGSGTVDALSFQMDSWTKNGLRYFVVGDASADDIRALSKLLRDAG
ncbi:MAG: zf-HC2 domain-containing protein [Candidatus Sulfotelmatobacter sp.]